jgi:hypothetical protein
MSYKLPLYFWSVKVFIRMDFSRYDYLFALFLRVKNVGKLICYEANSQSNRILDEERVFV